MALKSNHGRHSGTIRFRSSQQVGNSGTVFLLLFQWRGSEICGSRILRAVVTAFPIPGAR
jgi:hypothetical protein